jgi:hypothetical protein
MWPIGEQGEAWTRFWELEPNAVAFSEPTAPATTVPPGAPSAVTSPGAWPSPYGVGASYPPAAPSTTEGRSLPTTGDAYPTAGSGADDPGWRLFLSEGARVLMVVFIVLGALLGVANIALRIGNHSLQDLAARLQVQAAYDQLNTVMVTYEADTKACQSSLSCLTGPARTVAPSFGAFVTTLQGIVMPSDADAAESRLAAVGTHAETYFGELGAATTSVSYEEILQSNGPVLTQFNDAYQQLISQLE